MNIFLPFTVRHSGTCDSSCGCDCSDSGACPVYTETQQLSALDIIMIGKQGDHEWVESIKQGDKHYTVAQVYEAVATTVKAAKHHLKKNGEI